MMIVAYSQRFPQWGELTTPLWFVGLLSVVWLVMYGGLPTDLMMALWLGVLARLSFCAGGASVCGALRLERRLP